MSEYLYFWHGKDELKDYNAYVAKSQHIYGQVILAYNGKHDLRYAPPKLEEAINEVTSYVLDWADRYKEPNCYPILLRMNIAKSVFRMHIIPLSEADIAESTEYLWERIPEYRGRQGGILAFLGRKEHEGDLRALGEYNIDCVKMMNQLIDIVRNG